jgi:hypothetical protein
MGQLLEVIGSLLNKPLTWKLKERERERERERETAVDVVLELKQIIKAEI